MSPVDRALLAVTIAGLCASAAAYLLCDQCKTARPRVLSSFGVAEVEHGLPKTSDRCLRPQSGSSSITVASVVFGGCVPSKNVSMMSGAGNVSLRRRLA